MAEKPLILLGSCEIGGAERMALQLAVALREQGVDVRAATLRGGPLMAEFSAAGIPLDGPLLRWRVDPWAGRRLRSLLRRYDRTALIIADIYRNAMRHGLWAARRAGRPIKRVLWLSAIPTGQAGDFRPWLRSIRNRGWLDRVVCVSRHQQEQVFGSSLHSPGVVIHNGIDVERFASARPAGDLGPPTGRRIVQVANVMPDKDFNTLIKAAGCMRCFDDPPFEVLLAGRDTDGEAIAQLIREHGAQGVVRPLGPREDIPRVLASCDIFTLSSHSEVQNVAVLEAMAAGKKIVISALSWAEEVIGQDRVEKTTTGQPFAPRSAGLSRDDYNPSLGSSQWVTLPDKAAVTFMPGRAYDLARLWMVLADAPFETYLQASSMSDMERDLQQQDFRRFREAVHDHLVERARQQAEQFRIEDKARQWIELLESL